MNMKLIKTVFVSLLSIGMLSCQQDGVEIPSTDKTVTINLTVPGMENIYDSPKTYSMPADEATVKTVDVLVFATDPTAPNDIAKGTYIYQPAVGHTQGNTSFTTHLIERNTNQTILVLVNCRTEVNALLASLQPDVTTKAEVMQALTQSNASGFDASSMDGIGMWGEITNQNITASYNPVGLTVTLTRMLARVNIVNTATDFVLKESYLYNPRSKGAVIPDNYNSAMSTVVTPTIVSGADLAQGTKFGPYTTSAANKIESKIYTFEADNKTKAAADVFDATCVVVGGSYKGSTETHYYRVDIKDYTANTYFDILRNHSYNISITSVDGEGVDTPDEAYRGISKIKAQVEDWNMAEGNVDLGNNHLYVSNSLLFVKLDGVTEAFEGSGTSIVMTTDINGWTWSDDAETQQTLSDFGVTTMGGAKEQYVNIEWSTTDITTSIPKGRGGRAIIVSGNLRRTINFIQDNCGRYNYAVEQKIGKHNYITHRYGENCWMVANSMEGTSGFQEFNGDPYRINGFYYNRPQATQANNACPTGWRLPTKDEFENLSDVMRAEDPSLVTDPGTYPTISRWWLPLGTGRKNNAFAGAVYLDDLGNRNWFDWSHTGFYLTATPNYYAVSGSSGSTNKILLRSQAPSLLELGFYSVRCIKNE